MNRYLITFHTHLSALLTAQMLEKAGISTWLGPVPRSVSSSCGTAMECSCAHLDAQQLHQDWEGIFILQEGRWQAIASN